jgi:Domain of unknown function (DUF4216)
LEKARQEDFANWLHNKILTNDNYNDTLRIIALRPEKRAMCYEGCDTNIFQFYTKAHEQHRSRDNSGVCVRGETTNQTQHDYYGVLKEVIELTYDGVDNKVLLFKCHWFDITNGVKVDHEHGLVEVKHISTLRTNEPFVLACQATQVYYLPYASDKRERRQWSIVMKTKRKGKLGVENIDANQEFFQEEQPNCPISISIGQEFIWNNVIIQPRDYEAINPDDLSYRTIQDVEQLEEEEEVQDQEVQEQEVEEPEEDSSEKEDW